MSKFHIRDWIFQKILLEIMESMGMAPKGMSKFMTGVTLYGFIPQVAKRLVARQALLTGLRLGLFPEPNVYEWSKPARPHGRTGTPQRIQYQKGRGPYGPLVFAPGVANVGILLFAGGLLRPMSHYLQSEPEVM